MSEEKEFKKIMGVMIKIMKRMKDDVKTIKNIQLFFLIVFIIEFLISFYIGFMFGIST